MTSVDLGGAASVSALVMNTRIRAAEFDMNYVDDTGAPVVAGG